MGHHVVHHKIQCGFPRFSPHPRFLFFSEGHILSKVLGDFRKGSPAHLENLRNDTRIFALECQNSARRETTLAKLAKLAKLQNLQNLRCRSAHCLQPVIPVPLRGGGRSSERCSEGPGVLLYIALPLAFIGVATSTNSLPATTAKRKPKAEVY